MATRELRTQIDSGAVPSSAFTDVQLKAIRKTVKNRGQTTVYINSGLTPIFLHQDTGRMQLVPEVLHNGARHVGWGSMSKGNKMIAGVSFDSYYGQGDAAEIAAFEKLAGVVFSEKYKEVSIGFNGAFI